MLNKSKYSLSSMSENDEDEEDSYEGGVDEPVDEREFDEIEDDVGTPDYDDVDDDDDDCSAEKITLDRFKLALKYEQKQVALYLFVFFFAFHLYEQEACSGSANRAKPLKSTIYTVRLLFQGLSKAKYSTWRRSHY